MSEAIEQGAAESRGHAHTLHFTLRLPQPVENVWPMVQAGKGITEMLLGSEDL